MVVPILPAARAACDPTRYPHGTDPVRCWGWVDEVAGNVAGEFHYGYAEKGAAAFTAAAHVTRLEIPSNRILVCPMEPRSAIADYDLGSERWTLHVGCQGVFGLRNGLAAVLGVDRDKVPVLTGNVGGSSSQIDG